MGIIKSTFVAVRENAGRWKQCSSKRGGLAERNNHIRDNKEIEGRRKRKSDKKSE